MLQRASKFLSSATRPAPLKLFHGSRPCLTRPSWCGSYCFGRTGTGANTIHLSIMFLWVIYRFPLSICCTRGVYLFHHSVLKFVYVSAFRRLCNVPEVRRPLFDYCRVFCVCHSRTRTSRNPGGGGGHSHTLPIRVCAAHQRGRDFEVPDLERGIHFRGVF